MFIYLHISLTTLTHSQTYFLEISKTLVTISSLSTLQLCPASAFGYTKTHNHADVSLFKFMLQTSHGPLILLGCQTILPQI